MDQRYGTPLTAWMAGTVGCFVMRTIAPYHYHARRYIGMWHFDDYWNTWDKIVAIQDGEWVVEGDGTVNMGTQKSNLPGMRTHSTPLDERGFCTENLGYQFRNSSAVYEAIAQHNAKDPRWKPAVRQARYEFYVNGALKAVRTAPDDSEHHEKARQWALSAPYRHVTSGGWVVAPGWRPCPKCNGRVWEEVRRNEYGDKFYGEACENDDCEYQTKFVR